MPRPAAGFSSVAGLTWDRLMNSTRRAAGGGTVGPLSELALGDVAAAVMREPLSARMGGRGVPGVRTCARRGTPVLDCGRAGRPAQGGQLAECTVPWSMTRRWVRPAPATGAVPA